MSQKAHSVPTQRIAVVGIVLDNPETSQQEVNTIISQYAPMIRGRMGIPFALSHVSVISLTVVGTVDDINSLAGKLGRLPGVSAGFSLSKKEFLSVS